MGVTVGLLAEYSKIYPELNETIENLSHGIPKKLILQAGTTFLANQTMDYSSAQWLDIANTWFRTENFYFKEDLIKRVSDKYRKEDVPELTVLTPITSLRLLQLGLTKNETEDLKDEKQIEIDLFKIYLLLNESFTLLHTLSSEYIDLHYADVKIGAILLNMSFSTNDLTNYIYSREFYCQSVKAMFLSDFIRNEKKLNEHIGIFYEKYSIKSMEEYLSRVYGFLNPIGRKIKEGKKGFIEYSIKEIEDKAFALKISVQDYSDKDDIDFRVVRATPLVEIEENVYRLTHPVFITDKLYKGLYFDLSKINEGISQQYKLNEFRSFYTSNFSEKYLLYEVVNYCLNKRYIHFNGTELEDMDVQGAPDYYIRNGKHIILIENKDVLIKAEVKEQPIFENLEVELRYKFLEKGNGRGVGIRQIVSNIEKALFLQNAFDKNYKPRNVIIYPILIVHDIVYDCPGLNHLFNKWFFREIDALKEKGCVVTNVKPLIVLNIDTLIRVSQLLRIGKISLVEIFEVYYKNLKVTKKFFKDETEMKNAITDVYMPSTKVIENWLDKHYGSFVKDNKILEYALNKMKS